MNLGKLRGASALWSRVVLDAMVEAAEVSEACIDYFRREHLLLVSLQRRRFMATRVRSPVRSPRKAQGAFGEESLV